MNRILKNLTAVHGIESRVPLDLTAVHGIGFYGILDLTAIRDGQQLDSFYRNF